MGRAQARIDSTAAEPARRCVATGAIRPRAELVRFVLAPDGRITPDTAGKLPGRGLWLTARRDIVALAARKRLFARAARQPVIVDDDLADRVERLLAERCRNHLGLAQGAGQVATGFAKVGTALTAGKAAVLVAAADGAADGRRKLRSLAPGLPVVDVLTSAELSAALGREHVVHAALAAGRLAEALLADAARLAGFRGAAPLPAGEADGSAAGPQIQQRITVSKCDE